MNFFQRDQNNYFLILILCLLIFVCHGVGLGNDFVWDDISLVVENGLLSSWENAGKIFLQPAFSGIGNYYRPMMIFSFLIDAQLWGLNPFPFHLMNLILHAIAVIALFLLLNCHFSKKTAFICAAVYSIHPLNVSNVAAISCRNGLLENFLLWSLLFQHRSYINGKKYLLSFAFLFFVLAIFSRESALLFPVLTVAYSICFLPKFFKQRANIVYLSCLILAVILYLFGRYYWMPFSSLAIASPIANETIFVRFWTGISSIPQYLTLFIMPLYLYNERHFIYSSFFDVMPWASIFLIILVFASAWKNRHKNIYIAFGSFWLLLTISPTLNIVPLNSSMEEHWFCFSAIGLYFILGKFIDSRILKNEKMVIGISLLFLIFFGVRTMIRTLDWKDNFTFFSHEVKYAPNSFNMQANLGTEFLKRNEIDQARFHLLEAIRIFPDYGNALNNLGVISQNENNLIEAEDYFRRAIRGTVTPSAYSNLAAVLYQTNRLEEARMIIQEGRDRFPEDPNIANAASILKVN